LRPAEGGRSETGPAFFSFFGGPVLARGGSGDVLAGLIGGLAAQTPADLPGAAARGVAWHGLAADWLARTHGQTSVTTTQLLDFLPAALRQNPGNDPAGPPAQGQVS
ncbi:MAG: NAD(P)H-hydrate dehydratase, partial [Verrucomicrobiota bacterium]